MNACVPVLATTLLMRWAINTYTLSLSHSLCTELYPLLLWRLRVIYISHLICKLLVDGVRVFICFFSHEADQEETRVRYRTGTPCRVRV